MIWWILGIALLVVICVFMFLFVRGADPKKRNAYEREVMDNEQEKAMAELLKAREEKGKKS